MHFIYIGRALKLHKQYLYVSISNLFLVCFNLLNLFISWHSSGLWYGIIKWIKAKSSCLNTFHNIQKTKTVCKVYVMETWDVSYLPRIQVVISINSYQRLEKYLYFSFNTFSCIKFYHWFVNLQFVFNYDHQFLL